MESNITPLSVRQQIWHTRHKKELPLYFITIFLGVIAVFVVIYIQLQDGGILEELQGFFESEDIVKEIPDFSRIMSFLLIIASLVGGIGTIILLFVASIVLVYKYYGNELSYAIRVSENNFPEIYQKVREYTYLLGLKKEPEVFITQENGKLNAFSAWIPGRCFIQLNAEIVDIAYMEHKDFDTLFFVMAHEMGHIYLHHVQLYYTIWTRLASFIPFFGSYILLPMFERTREYSADRVAQALTGGKNERECMLLLGAGRHLYKHMDAEAYIREIMGRHNVPERLGRWVTNLLATHPIMPYRTAAVLDPQKKSGRLL